MECVKTVSSLVSGMDFSADPCEDFYTYSCGKPCHVRWMLAKTINTHTFSTLNTGTWVKKHVIPEDRSSLTTFEVLSDNLHVILKGILIPFAFGPTPLTLTTYAGRVCWQIYSNKHQTAQTIARRTRRKNCTNLVWILVSEHTHYTTTWVSQALMHDDDDYYYYGGSALVIWERERERVILIMIY